MTVREIEADGYPITARVPAGERDPSPRRLRPQPRTRDRRIHGRAGGVRARTSCSVLGDRFEVLAAALAATGLSIPIAHLHGGELSEGSLDDAMRHCVTKLAHLHFVATRQYAERVCQLGEEPWRVHVVGAAGLESILALELLDRDALARTLALEQLEAPPGRPHPSSRVARARARRGGGRARSPRPSTRC